LSPAAFAAGTWPAQPWAPSWSRCRYLCTVSNLSAQLPRDALRSWTSPRAVGTNELGRYGEAQECVGTALASYGRCRRFKTCHAHNSFLQVTGLLDFRREAPVNG
jgi:hypothetical protein